MWGKKEASHRMTRRIKCDWVCHNEITLRVYKLGNAVCSRALSDTHTHTHKARQGIQRIAKLNLNSE